MTTTWVVIGHRAGARIFEHRGPGKGLSLIRDRQHPLGRVKESEAYADRNGRAFDSHGMGRHGYGHQESSHDRAAADLARDLADTLTAARNENRFRRLVLVAEPKFLGMMRDALDPETAKLVSSELRKDLANVDEQALPKHLGAVLPV